MIGNQSGGLIYFQSDTTTTKIVEELENLHIYPVPATHNIYIRSEGEKTIYNTFGQVVIKSKKKRINIQQLDNGIYWIKCKERVGKIIKQ